MPPSAVILRGTSPAAQIFAHALSSAYLTEWPIIDPDYGEQNDFSVWEKIKRDAKVYQAINIRTAAVASKNWHVEPASDDAKDVLLANLVEEMFEGIPHFREARKFLAQGIFRGRAYLFVESGRQRMRLQGLPAVDWWVPTRLKHRDKRVVRIVPERRDGRLIVRKELWDPDRERWFPIPRELLIEVIYDDEQGRLGYGWGVIEALYFLWWAKGVVMREGLQAVERWAQGFLVGKVDTAKVGSTAANTQAIRDTFRDELEAHRSRHVAVVDAGDEIELVSGGGEGWQIVQSMLNYLDDAVLQAALGSILPFGGGQGERGSRARAEVEEDVSDELLEYDRGIIDEGLKHLIGLVLKYNRDNLRRFGLLDARPPRFTTRSQKRQEPEKNAVVIKTLREAGIPLKKEEVYEKAGFSMPSEGDEVFEGLQPAMAGGGLGVPGGGGSGFGAPSLLPQGPRGANGDENGR